MVYTAFHAFRTRTRERVERQQREQYVMLQLATLSSHASGLMRGEGKHITKAKRTRELTGEQEQDAVVGGRYISTAYNDMEWTSEGGGCAR